jgi:uncharacterized membrane protein
MEHRDEQNFRAVLTPHRSLSRNGFMAVMALVIGVNFVAGTAFALLGAWPVTGFAGLDVLIVWWAFRRSFADGRRAEQILVTSNELVLQRMIGARLLQELHFVRRSVRVELDVDSDRELIGGLYIRSGGRRTEIGSFLPPDERQSFSVVLRRALIGP